MIRRMALAVAVAAATAAPVFAQDAPAAEATAAEAAPSLSDLRAGLKALSAELKALRAELRASGAKGYAAAGGDSAIDRMNAMEREISRLTGETERLKNRVDRVVRDGTNRIGDIEFRLCEMDENCELGALTTPTLGDLSGGFGAAEPAITSGANLPQPIPDLPLTADEQRAFDAATAAMQAGEFTRAADLFAEFARAHAGSPAAAEAQFLRGAALDNAGDPKGATAAWLSAFAAAPAGPRAPDALLGLARVSADGKPASAGCAYLAELTARFAGSPQAVEADKLSASAGCAAAAVDPEAEADLADGG